MESPDLIGRVFYNRRRLHSSEEALRRGVVPAHPVPSQAGPDLLAGAEPPHAAGLVTGNQTDAGKYAYAGWLVVTGRNKLKGAAVQGHRGRGGHRLIYLDASIDNSPSR